MITDLTHKEARATVARQAPFCLDPDEATILIVDDEEMDREIISLCLERLQWPARIHQATDGEEAWSLLPALRRPTIVVTDLHMPHGTGLELVRRIRGDLETTVVPTFVMSDQSTPARVHDCMVAGATGFFPKPRGLDQMQVLVKALHAFAFQHCFTRNPEGQS